MPAIEDLTGEHKTAADGLQRFFAPCPKGLEHALAEELAELGVPNVAVDNAGVTFSGDWSDCYRANLWSRIASRVLWHVGSAKYRNEDEIYGLAHGLPWHEWFDVSRTIRVNTAAIASPLRSLEFVTLRVKDAVCDRFRAERGARPSVDTVEPEIRIHVFLTAKDVTLYLDTSGDALFKRGHRKQSVEAPIRENLAAGILRIAKWQPSEPLLDPMCGSGTFLIEAAQQALRIAPGSGRTFAFENFSNLDARAWTRIREESESKVEHNRDQLKLFGADRDVSSIKAARLNLSHAGVIDCCTLEVNDVLTMNAPASHGVIVTNPPYGVRVGEADQLAEFYPKLGNTLKQKFSGWRAFLFSADTNLAKLIGLRAQHRTPLFNGALECRLYEYVMVSGAMRRVSGTSAAGAQQS
jgi:putative N6-adenine-specific DNA methylase